MLYYGTPLSSSSSSSQGSGDSSGGGADSSSSKKEALSADNGIENIGLAVFKSDKLVSKLNTTETLCNLIVTNKLKNCRLSIPDPDDETKAIDLYLTLESSPHIKVSILNGTPYVHIKLKMTSRISSINQISKHITDERIAKIEESLSHYLKSHMLNYLYKTSKEFHSDISGLGKFAICNFKTSSEFEKYNWLDNYENAFFEVDSSVKLKSSYLLTGS